MNDQSPAQLVAGEPVVEVKAERIDNIARTGETTLRVRQQDIIVHVPWDPKVPLQTWLKLQAAIGTAVAKALKDHGID